MLSDLYKDPTVNLFLNALPGAFLIYCLDKKGNDSLLFLSDTAEVLWGVSKESAMKDIDKLWAPIYQEDLPAMATAISASAENLSFWDHTWRIKHPNGSTKWLNGRAQPIRDAKTGDTIWQTVILDVSKLKKQEESVKNLSKRLEVYSIKHSHELRAPLTQLMGLADLINAELNDQEKREQYFVNELLKATRTLDKVIRDMANDLEHIDHF